MLFIMIFLNVVCTISFVVGGNELDNWLIAAMFIQLADLYCEVWKLKRNKE